MSDVTRILESIEHGNPKAADELMPLVYGELRKLAAAFQPSTARFGCSALNGYCLI